MAKTGSIAITITIDDSPGGTPRIITPFVTSIGGIGLEALTQQTNPFGAQSEQYTPTGLDKTADIAIGGFYDDTATLGPKAIFGNPATWILDKASGSVGRNLVILIMTGATFTVKVHMVKFEVLPKNGNLTEYSALVRQAAAGVWS